MNNFHNCNSYINVSFSDRINLFGSEQRRNVFPMRYERDSSCVLNKRQDDG
jgi:hypothetical protein